MNITIIELLRTNDIFRDLPEEQLARFASELPLINYSSGKELIRKGEEGNAMFVIASGKVKIHDGEHIVATLSAGNYFGEYSLLDSAPRSMSVTAMEEVELLIVERKQFYDLMQERPELTIKFVSALTKRLRNQNESIISQLRTRGEELEKLVSERTSELRLRNAEISVKNKEITDNVNYARRIQEALLPGEPIVKKLFPEAFVVYMPKDIVSGDFYAVFHESGITSIVAADCTGHGVTGAMLSVVGNSLLERIIDDNTINTPEKILDRLNEEVIQTLNQRNNDLSDGMDIAICSLDPKKSLLSFAGANRPLWLIRNNEVLEFKGDKFPVGGLQINASQGFTRHEISLHAGDTFYIFTDGFADQFGGTLNKKLMTKKFREILLSVNHMDLSLQKDFLISFFNEWKGNNEQVDDVLVIGIRV